MKERRTMDIKSGYFPHDENARNDQKILQLRFKFGAEGYGIFWMLLETMYSDSTGYIDRGAIGGLSISYGVAIETLKGVIDCCLEIGLFKECDHLNIYNDRVIKWKKYRKSCADFGVEGAKKRWNLRNCNKNQTLNSPPIVPLIASKVKYSKVKKVKNNISVLFFDYQYYNLTEWKQHCPTEWTNAEKEFWHERAESYSNTGHKYIDWHKAVINWKKKNPDQYKEQHPNGFKMLGA